MLAVINTDSPMRGGLCGKLYGGRSQLLFALQKSSIDSQLFIQKCDLCLLHLYSTPQLGRSPSKYCYDVWYRKTRMVWLPDRGKKLKICLFVSTEFTNMTDGRAPHDGISRACIASRGKNQIIHFQTCSNFDNGSTN